MGERERERKKRKKITQKLDVTWRGSNHRPINRKPLNFQVRHEGLDDHVGRRAYFVRYMLFLRIRLCSRRPFGVWNKFHTLPKMEKMKTSLVCRILGFYTSTLQTFTMEQVDPQDVGLPLSPLPSVNVYRKEPNAFIYDEHSRECTMFHFGIYRHSAAMVFGCSKRARTFFTKYVPSRSFGGHVT